MSCHWRICCLQICHTKVNDFDMTEALRAGQKNIIRLDVPMRNPFGVKIAYAIENLRKANSGMTFTIVKTISHSWKQLSSRKKLCDQIHFVVLLIVFFHRYYIWMLQAREDSDFIGHLAFPIHNTIVASRVPRKYHSLDSVLLLCRLFSSQQDQRIATSPQLFACWVAMVHFGIWDTALNGELIWICHVYWLIFWLENPSLLLVFLIILIFWVRWLYLLINLLLYFLRRPCLLVGILGVSMSQLRQISLLLVFHVLLLRRIGLMFDVIAVGWDCPGSWSGVIAPAWDDSASCLVSPGSLGCSSRLTIGWFLTFCLPTHAPMALCQRYYFHPHLSKGIWNLFKAENYWTGSKDRSNSLMLQYSSL